MGRGNWDSLLKGYRVLVLQDEKFLEICYATIEYSQHYWMVRLKMVRRGNFILCFLISLENFKILKLKSDILVN